jgi:hypothetical protein
MTDDISRYLYPEQIVGGVALLRAAKVLDELKTENDDQKTGINIVRKALSWPARLIANKQDAKGQTEQILKEIDRLLKLCGTDKTKVVSSTIWVSDIRLRDPMNEAWNAWTKGENLPGRACIEAKLADPQVLVEIAVVAAK